MRQLLTDLLAVRELLSAPERWTQGCSARSGYGEPVPSSSANACCFCPAGAVWRVIGPAESDWRRRENVCEALRAQTSDSLAHFNDAPERTHAEVLALIDKAIETERAAA